MLGGGVTIEHPIAVTAGTTQRKRRAHFIETTSSPRDARASRPRRFGLVLVLVSAVLLLGPSPGSQ
jgi:hypothetical protein